MELDGSELFWMSVNLWDYLVDAVIPTWMSKEIIDTRGIAQIGPPAASSSSRIFARDSGTITDTETERESIQMEAVYLSFIETC